MQPTTHRMLVALALALLVFCQGLYAQPIALNTQVRSFTAVSASPYVADIWAFTDQLGRDFALVCRGDDGLSIYEITNPTAPVFAASITSTGSDMKDVKVIGTTAYCVQQNGGTRILDITDPYAATIVGHITSSAHNCFAYGPASLLFLARSGETPPDVEIYDISIPASPVFLSSYRPSNESFHDIWADDGYLYASIISGPVGTDIVDLSNPSSPAFVAKVPTGSSSHSSSIYTAPGGQKILVSANETAGGHIKIYDVTNPAATPLLSEYVTDPTISVHNPVVVDRYCFISYYADYLRILDLSNPASPVEIGIFDPLPSNAGAGTFDGAWGVAHVKALGNGAHRVLLTQSFATPRGFWVVDFTPPPVLDLELDLVGGSGHVLSVTGADAFSQIYNVVSPTTNLPFGTGVLLGLQGDAYLSLTVPLGVQPFHVQADGSGSYAFTIPLGVAPGFSFDVRSVSLVGNTWTPSELARYTL